jgi:hypothetical protein
MFVLVYLELNKSINRKDRKGITKDRKEMIYSILTLRTLRLLGALCG